MRAGSGRWWVRYGECVKLQSGIDEAALGTLHTQGGRRQRKVDVSSLHVCLNTSCVNFTSHHDDTHQLRHKESNEFKRSTSVDLAQL